MGASREHRARAAPLGVELSSNEIARLRLAYQRMRALPASDGRSLQGQRNVHAYYCVTCPPPAPSYPGGDIHGSWNFLPWHRMFLHFHERIWAA